MPFLFFDPLYLLFMVPAMLLAAWAQWKVKSAYNEASQMRPRSGMSGAEAAQRVLQANGLHNVNIEMTRGFLGDHYDPRHKVLRLSPDVYQGRSLAAVGIAAHEAGHAIQDRVRYAPLVLRNGIVPLAGLGTNLSWLLIIGGFIFHSFGLIIAGIVAFSAVVIFQLINLPVEFNASSRARQVLLASGIVTSIEDPYVKRVLTAAAMTYVAATLTAILQLLYFVMLALGSRR